MKTDKKYVLAIGGSDPSGGAGVQADQSVFINYGIHGLFAVTAVTAQNEEEVLAIHPVPADVLTQQISTACKNKNIFAVKIGMVATKANVKAIAWFLRRLAPEHVIIDPVLHSSSGAPLLDINAHQFFRQVLLPMSTVITPNLSEASAFAGMNISGLDSMKKAAEIMHREAIRLRSERGKDLSVIVKGGHLKGDAVDVMYDGKKFHSFPSERIKGKSPRGTGCRFASAMASNLAAGLPIVDAVLKSKDYLLEYIKGYDSD